MSDLLQYIAYIFAHGTISSEIFSCFLADLRGLTLDVVQCSSARAHGLFDILRRLLDNCSNLFYATGHVCDGFARDEEDISKDETEGGRCGERVDQRIDRVKERGCVRVRLFLRWHLLR